MAEKLNNEKRHEQNGEVRTDSAENAKHKEKIQRNLEKEAKASKHEHHDNLDKIRNSIDKEITSKKENAIKSQEVEPEETDQPVLVNRELKDIAYKRTIRKVQAKLPRSTRLFSKLIHQPKVEKISEIGSKTIARPSGILFGGITSFVGSSIFLWFARHYGYEYNFLLFIMLFLGGFFVGLLIELALRSIRRK